MEEVQEGHDQSHHRHVEVNRGALEEEEAGDSLSPEDKGRLSTSSAFATSSSSSVSLYANTGMAEQMRIGTTKVQDALGSSFSISEKEIQEALWHYYYDIDKSVSYLKSKFHSSVVEQITHTMLDKHAPKAPQPKKQKPVSRFDQVAAEVTQKSSGKL